MQGTREGCTWAGTLHQLRIRAADPCERTVTGFFSGAVSNPCAVQNGGCMHECRLDGTRPRCGCRVGFILAEDRKTCQGRFTALAPLHNDMRLMTLTRDAALLHHGNILLSCMFLSQTSTSARQKPATALTVATTRWALTSACATRPTSWDLTGNSATVCSLSKNDLYHTSRSLAADVYFI